MWAALIGKLEDPSALVGIVGLGHMGLPVATNFAAAGYKVLGVDSALGVKRDGIVRQ